jgi:hypothetical protein
MLVSPLDRNGFHFLARNRQKVIQREVYYSTSLRRRSISTWFSNWAAAEDGWRKLGADMVMLGPMLASG